MQRADMPGRDTQNQPRIANIHQHHALLGTDSHSTDYSQSTCSGNLAANACDKDEASENQQTSPTLPHVRIGEPACIIGVS